MRSQEYINGYREGVKYAVDWLLALAEIMDNVKDRENLKMAAYSIRKVPSKNMKTENSLYRSGGVESRHATDRLKDLAKWLCRPAPGQ